MKPFTDSPLPDWVLQGFAAFRQRFIEGEETSFAEAVRYGQKPKAMVIACADSRVDPALLFSARPGELFVVRNVAALVPPPEAGDGHHGVSAALEFGVTQLAVPQILVIGHSHCGGVRGFLSGTTRGEKSYLARWLALLEPLAQRLGGTLPEDEDLVGRWAVELSLHRLASFPFVAERLSQKRLELFGLFFHLDPP